MKIVLVDRLPPEAWEIVRSRLPEGHVAEMVETGSDEELAARLVDAEVVLAIHRKLDGSVFALAPRLRLVQLFTAGYDSVDLDAAAAAGVMVAHAPGGNAEAVAEHTVLLVLALLKRLTVVDRATKAGEWPFAEVLASGLGDLADSVVGLVGMGHIGRAVASRLAPFGCRLLYTNRHRLSSEEEAALHLEHRSFDDLLGEATVVSAHLALSEETRGRFDAAAFARMRPGVIFVNTGRGELVDEEALRSALRSGHVAGAGLDVIVREGPGPHPFAGFDQVILTPHVAGASSRAQAALVRIGMTNVLAFLSGQRPPVGVLTP